MEMIEDTYTFLEYTEESASTAIYPEDARLVYPVLGLVDELEELHKAISQYETVQGFVPLTPAQLSEIGTSYQALLKELGDAYWYVAAVYRDLSLPDNQRMMNENDYYRRYARVGVVNPIAEIRQAGAVAAEMCGYMKKLMRDGDNINKRAQIMDRLKWVQKCLDNLCYYLKIDRSQVLQMNRDKLLSRQERGVLQGSGDNR